jgi:hypothetical protein
VARWAEAPSRSRSLVLARCREAQAVDPRGSTAAAPEIDTRSSTYGVAYSGFIVSTARKPDLAMDAREVRRRLQAATAWPRPELLRVEEAGGHAGGNVQRIEEEFAGYYSFLRW